MGQVSIQRVGYEQTIFERLKYLAPVGENVTLITEDRHLKRLRQIPPLSSSVDLGDIIEKLEQLKPSNSGNLFTILEPKPDSSRITIVFPDTDDILAQTIWAISQSMEPGYELYIGSANFKFGIFISFHGIEVWDEMHE